MIRQGDIVTRSLLGMIGLIALSMVGLLGLAACQPTQTSTALQSSPGQLFCAIATQGGGQILAGVVEAKAGPAGTPAGASAVLATGMSQAFVQASCDQAAKAVGGLAGVPVAPPANPAAIAPIAIVKPAS